MGLSRASTPDRVAANAMRAAETSKRLTRSRSRPPQCASQPKLRSTTIAVGDPPEGKDGEAVSAAFKHDEALLLRVVLDDVVGHAVSVRPFPVTLGDKAAVEEGLA